MFLAYINMWQILLLVHITLAKKLNCPLWIGESSEYKVQERFKEIQKDNNVLKANNVHFRRNSKHSDEYDYTIKLCDYKDTAVEQINVKSKERHVIGKHDSSSYFFGGDDVLLIEYQHGDRYGSHCDGKERKAWLIIRCEADGKTPELKVIEEGRYTTGNISVHKDYPCYISFEYNHPKACTNLKKTGKMSGGAIFCIVFVSIFSAYLIFGFLYQRFVRGAKGYDQIPNYQFWRMVGNASADGCNFVCRREEHSNTYKGMADALDIDSDENNPDDTMLPM